MRRLEAMLLIGLALAACRPIIRPDVQIQPSQADRGVDLPEQEHSTLTPRSVSATPTPAPATVSVTHSPLPTLPLLPTYSYVSVAGTPIPSPVHPISLENAEQVGLLAQWGNGVANDIAWSSDGRRFAVSSSVGVLLYETGSLRSLGRIVPPGRVGHLEFAPMGDKLAVLTEQGVWIMSVESGLRLNSLPYEDFNGTPPYYVGPLAFSPDGSLLAIAYPGSFRTRPGQPGIPGVYWVDVWNLEDGILIRQLSGGREGETGIAQDIRFSQDGSMLGVIFRDGSLRAWRLMDGSLIRKITFPANTPDYPVLALSPGLAFIATGMEDGQIRMYRLIWEEDSVSPEELPALAGHEARVRSLSFSPDGQYLASGSNDFSLRLWRVEDGKELAILDHISALTPVSFSPDGQALGIVTGGIPRIWHPPADEFAYWLEGFFHEVRSLAFNSDGTLLALGGWDFVSILRVANGGVEREYNAEGESVILTDDSNLAAASLNELSLWDTAGEVHLGTFNLTGSRRSWPVGVAFAPDGSLLATGLEDGSIPVWRTYDGSLVETLIGHTGAVTCVSFSPDGALLVSAADDGTTRVWNLSQSSIIHSFENHAGSDCGVAFSPDGRMLASTSPIAGIKLWDLGDGHFIREMAEIFSEVTWLTFSQDGRLIAGGLEDGTVRLWNVATGFQVRSLEGHTGRIHALVFSSDGRYLASASEDGTIRVWGVAP